MAGGLPLLFRRLSLAWVLLAVPACAGLEPHRQIMSDGIVSLAPDEGVLVVDVESDFGVSRLFFGPYQLPNVHRDELRLVIVRAGRYSWDRVEVDTHYNRGWIYELDWIGRNEFEVRAGEISYPGKLVLERLGGRMFAARVVNRSTEAVQELLAGFPKLVASRPLRYGGFGRDDFLEEYLEAASRSDAESEPGR